MSDGWYALLFVLILAVVIGGPYALLWALNRLFALGLGYSFLDWLAALTLIVLASTPSGKASS